ncbi:MAG: GGDEF domain-containing protein [Planctomycetes bacterium]|nr:GGDEF domain-containing protein [Planctomycetota bacterium]
MDWLLEFWNRLTLWADAIVSGGTVVALAAVCLVQYLLTVRRGMVLRREREQHVRNVMGLEEQLAEAERDRSLTRIENSILKEFVSQTDLDTAIGVLLRRFVPDEDGGLGAFLQSNGGRLELRAARGLSAKSRESFTVAADDCSRALRERVVVCERKALEGNLTWQSLSGEDRPKVLTLFLMAVGDESRPVGFLLSTSLYPPQASREEQLELVRRLMHSLAGTLRQSQEFERQRRELRFASEKLELRAIADRRFATPLSMLEAFLENLAQRTGCERAVMVLSASENDQPRRVISGGRDSDIGAARLWSQHEDRLIQSTGGAERAFDADDLEVAGIDSLIGGALVVPLMYQARPLGALCLSKRERRLFGDEARRLARWAAEYLSDLLVRVLNYAVVERMARHDGLTDLANRRELDRQLPLELDTCGRSGGECSLVLLDLDRFKSVNDTWGHQAGDAVLKQFAEIIRERLHGLRSGDRAFAARYGGEEVAILLPNIGRPGALRIAESIRQAVADAAFCWEGGTVPVTVSAGAATFPADATTPEALLSAADVALFQAKRDGRNRVCCPAEGGMMTR